MNAHSKAPRRGRRVVIFAVGSLALVALCFWAGWAWRTLQEREQLRVEAHRGLEGVWIDDTGQDVSYRFGEEGEFLIRQKIPGNLAPFTGDPGIEYRPWGTWSRNGESVSVRTERHWGFELAFDKDGLLRGEYVIDQWSGQGEHSQKRTPVVLKRKPATP